MNEKRLENELQLKANFTAMLVHDLRNPLQSIMGYSEFLRMDDVEKEVAKTGMIISKSADTMFNLINDMLDIYKFEADKMVIQKEDIILGTILYDAVILMKPLFSKNNIRYQQHLKHNARVQADSNRISRVMINFVSNAIKFSPENGTITASIKRVNVSGRPYQEFSVEDQGPGIEPGKQDLLFDAYAQLEDKSGTLPKGTGLGLAVSKLIIEAHDGIIGYRPGTDGGSNFYFQLPEA
jgi:signal transduction histidine kinase